MRKFFIFVLLIIFIVSGLSSCSETNGKKKEEFLTANEIKEFEDILKPDYKLEISEKLKKRILEKFQSEYPDEKFYFLVEPHKIKEKANIRTFMGNVHRESFYKYAAVLTTPKLERASHVYYDLNKALILKYSSEDDVIYIPNTYYKYKALMDIYGKANDIFRSIFKVEPLLQVEYQRSESLTEEKYNWIMKDIVPEEWKDTPKENRYIKTWMTFTYVVDDIQNINHQEIGDNMIKLHRKVKKEMVTNDSIRIRISDKRDFLSMEKIYKYLGTTRIKEERVKNAVRHWNDSKTKDVDYVGKILASDYNRSDSFCDLSINDDENISGSCLYDNRTSIDFTWRRRK